MTDSSQTIPNGWPTVLLGDVIRTTKLGLVRSSAEMSDNFSLNYLRMDAIDVDGSLRLDSIRKVEATPAEVAKYSLRRGDFLFNTRNSRELVGKTAVFEREGTYLFNNNIMRIRFVDDVDPKFVLFLFHTRPIVEQLESRKSGTTSVFAIYWKDLATLKIPLPPLAEQRRIAAILDKADAIRRKREEGIRRTEELLRSTFLEMFGDPVRNENHWPSARVQDAGEVQLGRQRAPRFQSRKYTRPYVRVANVFEDRIDLSDLLSMDFDPSDFATFRLRHGDILLNEGQSTELVGRPAMWRDEIPECCFQNTLVRFRSDPGKTVPEFALEVFLFYLRSGQFARISSKTSSVAHLGAGRFAEMPFPLPPLCLQQAYADRREKFWSLLQQRLRLHQDSSVLFHCLVQRAFRGNSDGTLDGEDDDNPLLVSTA